MHCNLCGEWIMWIMFMKRSSRGYRVKSGRDLLVLSCCSQSRWPHALLMTSPTHHTHFHTHACANTHPFHSSSATVNLCVTVTLMHWYHSLKKGTNIKVNVLLLKNLFQIHLPTKTSPQVVSHTSVVTEPATCSPLLSCEEQECRRHHSRFLL